MHSLFHGILVLVYTLYAEQESLQQITHSRWVWCHNLNWIKIQVGNTPFFERIHHVRAVKAQVHNQVSHMFFHTYLHTYTRM
jgi:hypothetical protein